MTGVFLAVGRIAGETAPLLLTAGQSDYLAAVDPAEPTPFLPGYIYNYSRSRTLDCRTRRGPARWCCWRS